MLNRDVLLELAAKTRALLPDYAPSAAEGDPSALRVAHAAGRVARIAELLLRCPIHQPGDLQILRRETAELALVLELAGAPAARAIAALGSRLGGRGVAKVDEEAVARALARKTG